MKKLSALLFFCASLCTSLMSQSQISGKIIDKVTAEPLVGAAVFIEKTTRGVVTDIDGNYTFPLEAGTYSIVISYVGYETTKMEVAVKPNEITYLNCAVAESKALMQEVVITATPERSATVAMMIERKKAMQVSDGISADMIRKTPDRSTSDVLKRVTGASIQEGKFAIIRGMNDRYNAGYLDGALLPSTEADRKAFAFDVVPANLIDNLVILKAGTPDVIGDFGGGVIKINAKAVPERFTQSITIGEQMHSLTTFKDFLQYKKFGGEQLNLLGTQRNVPDFQENGLRLASTFPTASEKAKFAEVSQQFNNDWTRSTVNAMPNGRLAYSLGLPIKLSDTRKMGLIVALNYANTRKTSAGKVNTYDDAGIVASFDDNIYAQNITTGGIFNLNYVGSKTQINFRNLLNTNSDNNSIVRTGFGNVSDDLKVQNNSNSLNYNRLYNSILSVKHLIGVNNITINGSVNFSSVARKMPDYRIVNYTQPSGAGRYDLALGDFFNSSSGRFFSNLDEKLLGGNVDISKQFAGEKVKTEVKVGYFYQNRDRVFESRTFVYGGSPSETTLDPSVDLSAKNIAASKLYLVEKTTNDLAYYQGKSTLNAAYVAIDQRFQEKLRAVYGARYENMDINVTNQKVNSNVSNLKQGAVLPSVNICYSLSDKINIRADYFASVNRPEFRELAPFAFYNFDKNAEIKGNKDLKIANLNNYDVRFELFPTGGQLISVGGFYKTIKNPIEFAIDLSQPFTTFTYQNEKSAIIYGLEFEVKKSLDFVGTAKFLSDMGLFSNLSVMKSSLTFGAESKATQSRQLQGQSPYIINAGVQYDNKDNGWFASIAGNRVGRRIAYVGVDAKYAQFRTDIYEAPRTVIDFQVGKNIKKMNIKLTLGDILRNDLVFYQDVNLDGKYTKSTDATADRQMFLYNNGFTAALGFNYTF
jgi:outer membrane receptor protein involved in Fe transport